MEKVPQAGYKIRGIRYSRIQQKFFDKKYWSLPFKLVKSFFQVRKIMKDFRPDAVIGVGGYSSFPVLRFGTSKRNSNIYS